MTGPNPRQSLLDGNSGYSEVAISADGSRVAVISGYRTPVAKGIVPHSTVVFASDGTPVLQIAGYTHLNPRPLAFLDQQTLLRGEHDGTLSSWCLP